MHTLMDALTGDGSVCEIYVKRAFSLNVWPVVTVKKTFVVYIMYGAITIRHTTVSCVKRIMMILEQQKLSD